MSLPRIRERFWRFASPSTLLLALLLFPLPWMQIQCTGLRNPPAKLTRIGVPKPVAEFIAPSENVIAIFTQSGWQAARGECVRGIEWDQMIQESMVSDREDDRDKAQRWEFVERSIRAKLCPSPLLTAYPFIMLLGIALGIALSPGRPRVSVLLLLIVVALALVSLQHLVGFPLLQAYRLVPWEQLDPRPGGLPPTPAEVAETVARDVRYTHWFWLAQYLTVAALGLVLAEACFVRRAGSASAGAAAPVANASGSSGA